ncbi:MAG: TlpA family protein disulfide reductase [Deltaproteobacteria bacterium]|nr:TlpA family protein disulfide reductase [Deltaproteobacteria bacterium]
MNWVILAAAVSAASPAPAPKADAKADAKVAAAAPDAHAPAAAEPAADVDPDLPKAGDAVLGFRLRALNPDMNGQFVGIDTLVGSDRDDDKSKLLVLSFMASYCKPCKKEMPYLQKLYAKYKDKGLRVLMVAVDTDEAGQNAVSELVKTNGVTFPVLKDIGGLTSRRYLGSRTPLPSMFIVTADGNIQSVKRGYNEQASQALLADVQKALGVPAEEIK